MLFRTTYDTPNELLYLKSIVRVYPTLFIQLVIVTHNNVLYIEALFCNNVETTDIL